VSGGFAVLPRDKRLALANRRVRVRPGDLAKVREEFLVAFLEKVLGRDPCHEDALMLLAHAYTERGDYAGGLALDQRLVRLRPDDPVAFYNLACSHALLSQLDAAFEALDRAVRLGFRPLESIDRDPHLENLRADPRFPRRRQQWHEKAQDAPDPAPRNLDSPAPPE